MTPTVSPPDVASIISPLLAAIPAAAMSSQPAPSTLELLSPTLRQRVQVLSSGLNEPWLRLLSYKSMQVAQLTEIALSGVLELHPVSGEVEVDWDSSLDVHLLFKRADEETLQALVVLVPFNLLFHLVYCTGDPAGGGDGWRVGEVGVANPRDDQGLAVPEILFGGYPSIAEAEDAFILRSRSTSSQGTTDSPPPLVPQAARAQDADEDDDEDDAYWSSYNDTPARTPAVKRSPAPQSLQQPAQSNPYSSASAEDAYFARYASVQPALDSHDPDEAAAHNLPTPPPPLGLPRSSRSNGTSHVTSNGGPSHANETPKAPAETASPSHLSNGWTLTDPPARSRSGSSAARWALDDCEPPAAAAARSRSGSATSHHAEDEERADAGLVAPRPASSASSAGSDSVKRLEEEAERRGLGEYGVKQHVAKSIRNLYYLSRASGIDREEFEELVKRELGVLAMVEDEM